MASGEPFADLFEISQLENGFYIDFDAKSLCNAAHERVESFTDTECTLLHLLAKNPQKTFAGKELLNAIPAREVNTVHKSISSIRKKMALHHCAPIESPDNISKHGYRYTGGKLESISFDPPPSICLRDLYQLFAAALHRNSTSGFEHFFSGGTFFLPQEGSDCQRLRFLLPGDLFKPVESDVAYQMQLLGQLCPDPIVKDLYKALLPVEETAPGSRLEALWRATYENLLQNLRYSELASLYCSRKYQIAPSKQALKEKEKVLTALVEEENYPATLCQMVQEYVESHASILKEAGRELSLSRAAQKQGRDAECIALDYATAMILSSFHCLVMSHETSCRFQEQKKRYYSSLLAFLKEKLPPADSPSKQYANYLSNKPKEEAYAALKELIDCLREKGLLGSFSQEQLFVLFKSVLNSKNITPENGGPTLDLSLTPDK